MPSQIIKEFVRDEPKERYNQGDILKDLAIVIATDFDPDTHESTLSEVTLPYTIVLNQECDLEHDYNNRKNVESSNQDKFLPNILLLPAYLAHEFKQGLHRGGNLTGVAWNSKDGWKSIIQNNNSRFHFIQANEELQIPELIIDFKHFYTVDRNLLYKHLNRAYLASISEIYRESLSQRYSFFLSRIGLPDKSS